MPPSPPLPFSTMTDVEVKKVLAEHAIGLTIQEARKVETMLGRPPTLVEATIWGIQGSEHCSYKSSRRFLRQFVTTGKHVILGPKEDSGIVAMTDGADGKRWGIVVSHESHNHPSQIVPYEGAATGVGGCVRDVACMGARVIGVLDSLRFGDLQSEESRSIALEVVRGVAGYGNPLGIPNLGGDTVFDAAYNRNCLVNVVVIGLMREDDIIHSYVPEEAGKVGYDIIIVGKPTDRSGFGGASFASGTFEDDDATANTGAVQEPNPFLERHLLASTYDLFDILKREKLLGKVSFKDLGAGGNVCSTVEQVAAVGKGARVDLDRIHVALEGLPPEVISCAETQERFCWICHPDLTERILRHYNETWDLSSVTEGARASVVGKVTEDATYTLTHGGDVVCEAKSTDITSGLQYVRPTKEPVRTFSEPTIGSSGENITVSGKIFPIEEVFSAMLAHPTHASKRDVFVHYDKNIIGNTLIEPGEADASVIAPLRDIQSYVVDGTHPDWELTPNAKKVGVALASGGNGRYGRISPYLQGVNAVVEQMRNVVAVGALPRALTDCLNYGNPEIPEQLWALEQGVKGIADAACGVKIGGEAVPIISGNVSLYNATKEGPIDPTAIVCCIGVIPDAEKAITMQFKCFDSELFLLGTLKDECGGSAYYHILEQMLAAAPDALLGANVPDPDLTEVQSQLVFLAEAIDRRLILSAHDVSDGGLLLALFEMAMPQRRLGGKIGFSIDLNGLGSNGRTDTLLFSESGQFVMEVSPDRRVELESLVREHGCVLHSIGSTSSESTITVERDGEKVLHAELATLRRVWERGLRVAFGKN